MTWRDLPQIQTLHHKDPCPEQGAVHRRPRAVKTLDGEIVHSYHADPAVDQEGRSVFCDMDLVLLEVGFEKLRAVIGLEKHASAIEAPEGFEGLPVYPGFSP